MGATTTNFVGILKELYSDQAINNLVYKTRPTLALLQKDENFYGKYFPQPIITANPQGRSHDFSRAQARSLLTQSKIDSFFITRTQNYGVAVLSTEVIESSKSNQGAFISAASVEINGAINAVSNDLSIDIYKSGLGERGQVGSVLNKTITLAVTSDVVNFEVGMELMVSNGSTKTNALRSLAGSDGLIITSINRSTGVLTFNAANVTTTIVGTTTGDWLFVRGDRGSDAYLSTTALPKLVGFEGWLPDSVSASESFFGVDRSVDVQRLAGILYDGSAQPIEEALISATAEIAIAGGNADYCFVNPRKYAELEKSLGSKVMYVNLEGPAKVFFTGIQIYGQSGPIKVLPDRNVPYAKAFMLQLDTWTLRSLGQLVRPINIDSLEMLRQSTSDGVEIRYASYSQLSCAAPGWNCKISL